MSEERTQIISSKWFSTYGMITAERILGKYQIKLAHDDLVTAIKSPFSFYHKLLIVPMKNVLNGIVLQQANDYHIYVQKIFIDYLLSGENSKGEEAQGAATRETLENERQQLVTLGDDFHTKENEHNNLISASQVMLINISREFNAALDAGGKAVTATLKTAGLADDKNKVQHAITHGLTFCDLGDPHLQSNQSLFIDKMNEVLKIKLKDDLKTKVVSDLSKLLGIVIQFDEQVQPFIEQTEEMGVQAHLYRTQFYDTILRVIELIKLLPEYKIDPIQDAINREYLYFDKNIGAI